MAGKLIRVAHVMGHMVGGGVEATVMNHYRHIDRSRVQFDFVVDADSTEVPREEIESLGGRVFIVPPYKRLPQYLRACERLFREQKPDIVHSNINSLSVFPLAAAKRAGVHVRIAHSHSTADSREYVKTVAKNVLKPFSQIYPTNLAACSNHSARWLFGDKTVAAGRVHIIKNAIDLDKFAFSPEIRTQKRVELGVADGQLVIGQVGRLCSQKNQMFTLGVFAKIHKQWPDAVMVFAGDGPMRTQLKETANKLGISANVRFLGMRNDINGLYQAFDVLAFPSIYEGLSIAAIEAQAASLPLVSSTEVSGETFLIPELVQQLSLSDSSDRWLDSLVKAAMTPRNFHNRLQKMDDAGYGIQKSADLLCQWYEKLLGTQNEL